ncbi:DUF4124 domain-containing protein, partial [Stenotrophomonas maltophilia]|nr:DUF4124 domain-containing protein [Stenotrophomonas maltophilia]
MRQAFEATATATAVGRRSRVARGAGPVYKWKDSKGVTQYSETPPAGVKYETRAQARRPQP